MGSSFKEVQRKLELSLEDLCHEDKSAPPRMGRGGDDPRQRRADRSRSSRRRRPKNDVSDVPPLGPGLAPGPGPMPGHGPPHHGQPPPAGFCPGGPMGPGPGMGMPPWNAWNPHGGPPHMVPGFRGPVPHGHPMPGGPPQMYGRPPFDMGPPRPFLSPAPMPAQGPPQLWQAPVGHHAPPAGAPYGSHAPCRGPLPGFAGPPDQPRGPPPGMACGGPPNAYPGAPPADRHGWPGPVPGDMRDRPPANGHRDNFKLDPRQGMLPPHTQHAPHAQHALAPAATQQAPQREAQPAGPPTQHFQVRLSNIPPELTARDLAEAFGEVSSNRVESVDICRDSSGRATGEAVVVFNSMADGHNAVRRYHGGDLNGRRLHVVFEGEISRT